MIYKSKIIETKQKVKHPQLLILLSSTTYQQEYDSALELFLFLLHYSFLLHDNETTQKICILKTTHFHVPQGNGENGARYLDPKYSRWISTDPALGEYASGSDAGCGGIYNHVNLSLYHYGGNNPIRYMDPDGRDYLTSTLGAVNTLSEIWQNDDSYDKKMAFVSQFTQGFTSEYAYAKSSLSTKIRKTLEVGITVGVGLINPMLGCLFKFGVTQLEKVLISGESEQIIGEKQFDYLRTAEVELKNLDQLIGKTTDSGFKEFLLEQSELLESEYYINKLAIYCYYIPTIDPQYYGNNKQDLLIGTEFYKNRLKYFETVHSDAIKFFGFDSEGKVLTDKCLDYYSLYKQTRRVME